MCFTFKQNNKWTKKPVNRFLQDGASASIWSLQTSIVMKLCQTPGDGLYMETMLYNHTDLILILQYSIVHGLS